MHVKHCKLRRFEQLRLMEYFVAGTPGANRSRFVFGASQFCHQIFPHAVWRKTATQTSCPRAAKSKWQFCSKIELDENYFGGVHKGKRGRGVLLRKTAVFGILKHGARVYAQLINTNIRNTSPHCLPEN